MATAYDEDFWYTVKDREKAEANVNTSRQKKNKTKNLLEAICYKKKKLFCMFTVWISVLKLIPKIDVNFKIIRGSR